MDIDLRATAHRLTYHARERLVLFRKLSLPEQSAVFPLLSPYVQHQIVNELTNHDVVCLIDHLDAHHANGALAKIETPKRRRLVTERLKEERLGKTEYFLRFHPKAAVTLLNFNYLLLPTSATIDEAAAAIDVHHAETGKIPEVLVHERGELKGEVPLSVLVREPNENTIERYVTRVPTVTYRAEIDQIVRLFNSTKHGKIVVLDADGSVLGIIYSDDALSLFSNTPTSALYDFAGVAENERPFDSVMSKVKHRYKWLIINLGTGFLAASVVSLFENTINELVLLAIYMPIVAGMGGNAATQALAVTVRGINVGEIELRTGIPAILNEVGAGLINGIINGVIVAVVATLWNQDPLFGLVIGTAMVTNLIIAGFFGTVVPLLMKALGKDPATSATVFITTATDVFGFFMFLGLATLVLL
ncbi:MAG TPA: magnesium transporter [Candidatus Paceibacterota bacterium]|jgi:magnesium transporter